MLKFIRHGEQGVAEGEVKQFPKKHLGDLSNITQCHKCGGPLRGGTYQGERVKVCTPCLQVYKQPNSKIDDNGNLKEQGAIK
jgi:hypothetical protein